MSLNDITRNPASAIIRGVQADLAAANVELAPGELAVATDTGEIRFGPGKWNQLTGGPAPVVTGTLSQLTSDNPYLAAGQIGYASDSNELRVGPGNWLDLRTSGARELDRVTDIVGMLNFTGVTDYPGMAVSFTVAEYPVDVCLSIGWAYTSAANASISTSLCTPDNNQVSVVVSSQSVGAGALVSIPQNIYRVSTPGDHTIKARVQRNGSGNASILFVSNPAIRSILTATEVPV